MKTFELNHGQRLSVDVFGEHAIELALYDAHGSVITGRVARHQAISLASRVLRHYGLKTIPGVEKPEIGAIYSHENGKQYLILDGQHCIQVGGDGLFKGAVIVTTILIDGFVSDARYVKPLNIAEES